MMKGDKVLEIQKKLEGEGFSPGALDGKFGPHTQAAVIAFQIERQLNVDGEMGPATAAALGINLDQGFPVMEMAGASSGR